MLQFFLSFFYDCQVALKLVCTGSLIAYRLEDTEFPLNDQIISGMAIISLNEFSKITQRDQLERRIDLEYQQCIYLPKCLWEYARMDFLSTEPVV